MALIDLALSLCRRLGPKGLHSLLLEASGGALDIDQPDAAALRSELLGRLPSIDRSVRGFEDFSPEGERGIEPGFPARSLLFHALASPGVTDLDEFPTPDELASIENLVFGIEPPSMADLRARTGADLAVVLFANEYRPAKDTPRRTHADHAFSRTGVSRVGTRPPRWDGRSRGYQPDVEADPFAFHVCPAPFAPYLAVRTPGTRASVMRATAADASREFWIPVHKLFSGRECLKGLDLKVTFDAFHMNDKIRRTRAITLSLSNVPTTPPFRITDGIADVGADGVVVPAVHARLVEPARADGKLLTFPVPPAQPGFAALEPGARSMGGMEVRPAPAYVHARTKVVGTNRIDLNESEVDVNAAVAAGGYEALHYVDVTGEGYVHARVDGLAGQVGFTGTFVAAYSLVSAPDFFPSAGQRELFEESLPAGSWGVQPLPLSDTRLPANLQLPDHPFDPRDLTVTAVVGLADSQKAGTTRPTSHDAHRHSALPDDCAGVFAPGWDVSTDVHQGVHHLAAYGLGSPFPEDAKLCAALSTFWPAVAPDAARGMSPHTGNPNLLGTVAPMTDEEIGQLGSLPWDGVTGPKIVRIGSQDFVECASFLHVDYVRSALEGRFTLRLTSQVGAEEYARRIRAIGNVYRAHSLDRNELFVLSFRAIGAGDPELQRAQTDTSTVLAGPSYRVELIRGGTSAVQDHPSDPRKRLLPLRRHETYFVSPQTGGALRRRSGESIWIRVP